MLSCARIAAAVVLGLAVTAVVGQEPKKDPPKQPDPPKVDPKSADPKQPVPPKPPEAKPGDPKPPEPPKAVELKPGEPTRFDTGFVVGKKFHQEVRNAVTQVIKVQGQDLTQSQRSTFWYEWTPLKLEADKWHVRQKVEGLTMSIDISGNVINYDSRQPDANPTGGNPGLTEFFKKLVGAEFTAIIDAKTGKVEKVEGRDEFISKLGAGSPQMESLLKRVLTEDALKQMADPSLGLTAEAPKKPGDTWKRDIPVNLGPIGTYNVAYNFKYVGAEKDMNKVDVEVTLVYTAPKETPDGLLFRIKDGNLRTMDLTKAGEPGPGKGTILYDPKNQRVADADIRFKLKGDLTVAIGGTDTKVELTQEQQTSVKAGDASLMTKK